MAYLSQFAPAQVTGNLPGKSCTDLWLGVQLHLEECTAGKMPVTGVVADLVKAYNLLPRLPLLAIGLHLGIPKPIIRAWANALRQMQRAFCVRGTVGPSMVTSTGFAEGCGLSCSAMLLCNIALSRWLKIRFPSVRLWSYVDNLELTATSMSDAIQGLSLMTHFCELLDLQLDHEKTFFWSNDPAERAHARTEQLHLQYSARDLGAHMEYGRRLTNHVLRARINAMPRVWEALHRSHAPYSQKVQALKIKGWPQALNAGTSTHLGDSHLKGLRTGACRGLKVHAPGMSPLAHLSLVEHPMCDPACNLLVQTVFTFRGYADLEQVCEALNTILTDWEELPTRPGPCHVLLQRIHTIGWRWIGNGWFVDHSGQLVDVLYGPHVEIYQKLLEGWQMHAQRLLSARKTFQGMEWACPQLTLEKVRSLPIDRQGLLRTALNGTFFTADTQTHNARAHTTECKYCGSSDSQFHRFWECTHFHDLRPHPWLVEKVLEGGLPKCLTYHGWIGLPQPVREFQHHLLTIPDVTDVFDFPANPPSDLFLDGSCLNPTCPFTRLAGWGVTAADPTDVTQWWPIAQGLVPGRRQTSLRAEILAAISGLRFALRAGCTLRLWSDNALVVATTSRALTAPDSCQVSRKDRDLWDILVALARQVGSHLVTIHKVNSHQVKAFADPVERWAFSGNDNADNSARWSVYGSRTLFDSWKKATEAIEATRVLRDQIHDTILRISAGAVAKDPPAVATDPPQTAAPLPLVYATFRPLPCRPQTTTHKMVGDRWTILFEWSHSVTHPEAPIVYVPWVFLFLDFVLHTGFGGLQPIDRYRTWTWLDRQAGSAIDLITRVKWFRLCLQKVHRQEHTLLESHFVRPSSKLFRYWTSCVAMRLVEQRTQAVEHFVRRFGAAFSSSRQFAVVQV